MAARKKKLASKSDTNLLNDYHLLSFDSLDSTNEEAKRIAKSGGQHGAVVWAKKQSDGKGRLGRGWMSEDGNLFVSILLKPNKTFAELGQLSFVAAIAVIDAISPLVDDKDAVKVKWPNDILLSERKLSGVLLESFCTQEDDLPWVVVGVGVNIDSYPQNTEFPAICLKDSGVELVSAKIILSRFIHHFIERYNQWQSKGFAPIRKEWLSHAWNMQQKIVARLPNMEIEGVFEGINQDGSLIIALDGGHKQTINAADVYSA